MSIFECTVNVLHASLFRTTVMTKRLDCKQAKDVAVEACVMIKEQTVLNKMPKELSAA